MFFEGRNYVETSASNQDGKTETRFAFPSKTTTKWTKRVKQVFKKMQTRQERN